MKNILHVVNVFFVLPYFIGDQFIYFKNKGYNLHVICSPSDNLKVYAEKMQFNYKETIIARSISILQDLKSLLIICKYIRKNQIGIVVGHTPKGGLLAMLASKIMRVPKRIYFRHGLLFETSTGFMRNLLIITDRVASVCATKIVCVSPSVAKKSVREKLNPCHKQLVLGKGTCGGIDAMTKFNPDHISQTQLANLRERLNIEEREVVIGYCGRLVKDKGIIELIEAFKKLSENYRLLLVGDFEDRDALPYNIKNEIISNNKIIVTGFIYIDIEYYYSLMHIFILPSYREGFPTSVLEASSMKIPILTTKATGCIDSIIEDLTGYYIENNSESILNGILKISKNKDNTMRINARKFVLENFDNRILWPIIEKELYVL
jgi:glycosyltransferase involved in cell wall biosynthesis